MKKSLGKRRQARKAQTVAMVRYVTPKASSNYQNIKVEINVPIWIYGTIGGDVYSLQQNSNTWHNYLLNSGVVANFPELRACMNTYMFYKVNGASIAFIKTYGNSSVNEIRQAPPIGFTVGPALSTTQTSTLSAVRVFDMDDTYRVQPLSDDKDIGSRYYKFKNMRSGTISTHPAGLGEWENTGYAPNLLFSIGYKENPENAADSSIRIGACIVTVYISFKRPSSVNNY